MKNEKNYNGWKNHATWNIALWIQNDEGLYNLARDCVNYSEFKDLLQELNQPNARIADFTPDNVAWNDSGIDIAAIDACILDL